MTARTIRWAAIGMGIAFVVVGIAVLDVRIRDYDEGVYWQSLRAIARGEPLFSSVFASQPPGFYYALLPFYLVGHSLASLRLAVLVLVLAGLVATYVAGQLIAGPVAGLIALVLAATSPLYVHQSAIVQADGPSVAISMVAVTLALLAVRGEGTASVVCAVLAGLAFAFAVGIKLLGAVTVIPLALVLIGAPRGRTRLLMAAAGGCLVGALIVLLPALASPGAAFDELVLSHVRSGHADVRGFADNLRTLLLLRELPLEALALIGAVVAIVRKDRSILVPLTWVAASVLAVLFYHPLFGHHLVILSTPLALTAAVGFRSLSERGRGFAIAAAGLALATTVAGVVVIVGDVRLVYQPDIHDTEMAAAVRSAGTPADFWISDNPFAVAAADRNIPGPLVDTSGQRTKSGLLTVQDLETTRARYRVRWVLEDSFRLVGVPGYTRWLGQHFHPVRYLGGRAVIYEAN